MNQQSRTRAAEETLLAWRRTALQLGIGAVIGARTLAQHIGPAVIVAALAAVALAVVVHASASRAYSQATKDSGEISPRALSQLEAPETRLALIASAAVCVGLLASAWILIQALA
jgi:uncharacterized membrane protein YidH (DUF202 family)